MVEKDWKIISVGGSIIIPKTGFDLPFLKNFRELILKFVRNGERFILIVGGGATARQYQQTASSLSDLTIEELDWIGIGATIMNANFIKYLFKDFAYKDVITNPLKKVRTDRPIIVGAGWKPGCSTDQDAVLLAKTYKVKEVINLSNIGYVYDKDPNVYKAARVIEQIDWTTFRRDVVGSEWEAGKNAPFDPIASQTAEKLGLKVSILQGTKLDQVEKAINGEKFEGTVIEP